VGVLSRFERRLGGLVEGAFARVFKGGVEPVELAEALTHECDERRARGAKRTLVPNEFVIHLSDTDFQRLAPYRQALGDELATLVREHATAQRYTFVAPVQVSLELDPELSVGRYEIESAVAGQAPARGSTGPHGRTQVRPEPPAYQPPPPVQVPPIAPIPVRTPSEASRPTNPTHTGVELPRLIVSVNGSAQSGSPAAAGQELTVTLARPLTVIGRGSDVDVQLADTGVSRRHGEVILQPNGHHAYRDLGSTNGSKVNGRKVHEVPLVDGDRIEVGRSVLVYRHPVPPRSEGRQGGELSGHPAEA
jgi:pSer/pThr/pTyr-binding forkhead associated (FHA) protein